MNGAIENSTIREKIFIHTQLGPSHGPSEVGRLGIQKCDFGYQMETRVRLQSRSPKPVTVHVVYPSHVI